MLLAALYLFAQRIFGEEYVLRFLSLNILRHSFHSSLSKSEYYPLYTAFKYPWWSFGRRHDK